MVLCAKAALREAERVKQYLREHGYFLDKYSYGKAGNAIYFPVRERFESDLPIQFVNYALEPSRKKQTLKEEVGGLLSEKELAHLKSSFDTVGSIALIEVDDELREKERLIAEKLLENNKNLKTILKKAGGHEGELRLQSYTHLAGEKRRETIVTENGVRLKIAVGEVYYSVRSATERKRIASLVRQGERVLVMFSGAAPYPCVISKLTEAAEIVGIELNQRGHELGLENVRLNKLSNVTLIQGDVKEVVPELREQGRVFDRVIMPLPHTGHDFLDEAFMMATKGSTIHLYDFEEEGEFEKAVEKAKAGAARNGKRIKILGVTPSGQHSPRTYRVCVDFLII